MHTCYICYVYFMRVNAGCSKCVQPNNNSTELGTDNRHVCGILRDSTNQTSRPIQGGPVRMGQALRVGRGGPGKRFEVGHLGSQMRPKGAGAL